MIDVYLTQLDMVNLRNQLRREFLYESFLMSKAPIMKTVNNIIDFKSNIEKFLFSRTIDKGFSKNTAKA